jgi:hypothetical protein
MENKQIGLLALLGAGTFLLLRNKSSPQNLSGGSGSGSGLVLVSSSGVGTGESAGTATLANLPSVTVVESPSDTVTTKKESSSTTNDASPASSTASSPKSIGSVWGLGTTVVKEGTKKETMTQTDIPNSSGIGTVRTFTKTVKTTPTIYSGIGSGIANIISLLGSGTKTSKQSMTIY